MTAVQFVGNTVLYAVRLLLLIVAGWCAFNIRLFAVTNYGRVIHEFDPWFNYRAAEYLAANGAQKFFQWYDYSSWYPLGRPVGTTIYPGMQFAAVWIWKGLKMAGIEMSLNDVCVFVPAWFGIVATYFLGLLAYEGTRNVDYAVCATLVMSIIPAHLMRSVAGGYDNECVAVTCIVATFYFWCRSLRRPSSWPCGVLAGLAYFCMVASWGGYIFVVNMIGVHCAVLIFTGRYSSSLHKSYSLFFVIGTYLAIKIPVVGWTPLKSLEQIGPLGVFCLVQVLEFCEIQKRRLDLADRDFIAYRRKVFCVVGAVAVAIAAVLFQMGYFGPISSRVRGLFVQHTRTGNPLVDSVAEHQATSPQAYWHYLHYMCYLGPVGFIICLADLTPAKIFVLLYAVVTYYFSSKMNRLVLLMGPIMALLGGVAFAGIWTWGFRQISGFVYSLLDEESGDAKPAPDSGKKGSSAKAGKKKAATPSKGGADYKEMFGSVLAPFAQAYHEMHLARTMLAGLAVLLSLGWAYQFNRYCWMQAEGMSHPSLMFKSRQPDGSIIMVDDYREAYWWLRDTTPKDSRVMAWWDYGYQINGIAERTTIADGNTWNHEHIATLGRCLVSPEKKAHGYIRHLADYVLIWAGGGGDDIAKSPHMARIGNSVYLDMCGNDPTCMLFAVDEAGNPTKMMEQSLLWRMHSHNRRPGVSMNPTLFQEAYTSKHGLVRIFKVMNVSKESKIWNADPANRKCDAPGSWYCEGQYPPALSKLIQKRKAFAQLEDFNTGAAKDEEARKYQEAYHARMAGQKPV